MMKTLLLLVSSLSIVWAGVLEVASENLQKDVGTLIKSQGEDLISALEKGMADLEQTVKGHLRQIHSYASVQKSSWASLERTSRALPSLRFDTIKNLITCSNLTDVATEISLLVGNGAVLVARVVGTANNFSEALSNCSGNPFCVMSLVMGSSQILKDSVQDIKDFNMEIRSRFKRIMFILVDCAVGEESSDADDVGEPGGASTQSSVSSTHLAVPAQIEMDMIQPSRRFYGSVRSHS